MRHGQAALGALSLAAVVFAALQVAGAGDAGRLRFEAAIYADDKGVGMREPQGVACNDRSTLVVADTGRGRLLRYTVEDREAKPTAVLQAPQLPAPIQVQINSADEVFALDGKERRIVRFDAKGALKGVVDPDGVPGASIVARSFRIDRNDSFYILDVFSARVVVLDKNGKYQREIPFPVDAGFFSDLAVDGQGTVYLVDSVKAALYTAPRAAAQFSRLATDLRKYLSFPTAIAVDNRRVLYVVDQHGAGIVLVAQDGSVLGRQLGMGWTAGFLYYPSAVCITDKGQVFIADRGNSRVQLFAILR